MKSKLTLLVLSLLALVSCGAQLPEAKDAQELLRKAQVVCASRELLPGELPEKVKAACEGLKKGADEVRKAALQVVALADEVK